MNVPGDDAPHEELDSLLEEDVRVCGIARPQHGHALGIPVLLDREAAIDDRHHDVLMEDREGSIDDE